MDAHEEGGILSRLKWGLRGPAILKLDSISIMDGRYLMLSKGANNRLLSLLRVGLAANEAENTMDYASGIRATLQQQRMKSFFDGLHRSKVQFLYLILVKPSAETESENEIFEFDLVVGTWVDTKSKEMQGATTLLEQNVNVLAATLSVGIPNSSVRRLTRGELKEFAQTLLLPHEPKLPQVGDSSMMSALESFDDSDPMVAKIVAPPQFYIPNASESGRDGIALGNVKTRGGESHQFKLQLEDLKRHISVMGMTGAGKSTTASVIVRRMAALGLPVMVLDWHNEHRQIISTSGGMVLSPGKDNFTINPLDVTSSTDPVEHIALVTDIFSDIYHFTHPQAYMFRNALQRCLGDSAENEVPTLTALVNIIETYPLRSAYDNETKVALLRRLIPLTEGQAGRALNGASSHTIDELLDKVMCVELGHMRDIQTRSIFAAILLKMVYENRVTRKGRMEHVTLIEEARNLAPARRDEDPPSVGERMISELRKFGESMIFVAQFPTQVSSEIIKNSGVRVIHRIAWAEDLKLIGESLNMNKEQLSYISNLGVGEAVVSLSRLQQPILLQVDAGSVLPKESSDLSLTEEA